MAEKVSLERLDIEPVGQAAVYGACQGNFCTGILPFGALRRANRPTPSKIRSHPTGRIVYRWENFENPTFWVCRRRIGGRVFDTYT
ncbi:hypothetical protein [Gloeobacter violaceus]|uniref:Gsl1089 protein n=1 Tax=Gloeobacter violaceus (strain ATCC 29082 / PCC 7421) TaxID=251221 RepID=Q7NLN2_GLOVI|nr:hypothetical protein [Gloeobacter violaceus]BAC89030.1 gsl1089 [Gloeobacter violaceus PCC 7421]